MAKEKGKKASAAKKTAGVKAVAKAASKVSAASTGSTEVQIEACKS